MSLKRKRASVVSSNLGLESTSAPSGERTDKSQADDEISRELVDHIQAIRNGTFPKLIAVRENLLREMDKRVAIADRHRKLQIKNINELYESEVLETKARFERASAELQEQLIEELSNEASRQRTARQHMSTSGYSSTSLDAVEGSVTLSSNPMVVERSLRSGGAGSSEKPTETIPNGNTTTSVSKAEKSISSLSAMLSSARRRNPLVAVSVVLEKTLGEEEMRSDFYNIVRDLETRASAYVSRAPPTNATLPSVGIDANGRLVVGNDRYCVGDMVAVTSNLSGESFTGVLVVINSHEVILRSYSGPRFSFLVGLLRCGRICISVDNSVREVMNSVDSIGNAASATQVKVQSAITA